MINILDSPVFKNRFAKVVLLWGGFILLLVVSWWLRHRYLCVEAFSYDEGHWLMFGVLANAGYAPYSVTFVGIPPLALLTIQLGAKLFGPTLTARYPMMLFSLLGIVAIFWSLRPWRNLSALLIGFLGAAFLSFNLDYIKGSGSIMTEVPAVALALVSFALFQQYRVDRRLFWLFLSGVAFALSLALKLFVVFFPVLIGLLLLLSELTEGDNKSWVLITRRLLIRGGVWFLGGVVSWLIFALIYDPQAMYKQVFLFRLAFRDVNLTQNVSLPQNAIGVGQMLIRRSSLVVGAALGLIIGWRYRRGEVLNWFLWFILAVVPLVWQAPLRERYIVMLLPSLAALSAIAVVVGVTLLVQWLKKKDGTSWLSQPLIVLLSVGFVAWSLTTFVKAASLTPSADAFPDLNLDAVQYVWKNTTLDDCIVTDDQRFAFAANRLVPAALSETAIGRLATGWLTAEDIVEQIVLHDCPAVVYADWRFAKYIPDLREKLQALYFVRIPFDEDVTVYTVRKNATRQPDIPLGVQIGPSIILQGADISPIPWRSGQNVRLAAYWTAIQQPAGAYKIFVQLRDDRDEPVANFDHFPFPQPSGDYQIIPHLADLQNYSPEDIALYPQKGMLPTNAWPVNHTIREVTNMDLPTELPTGTYGLYIGLYDPDTLTRLLLNNGHSEFLVTKIEVVE